MDDLEKLQGTSSTLHQTLCIISNSSVNSNWSYCRETLNLGQNRRFFVPCDLEFWWITLKSSRAPLLCCFKLCASFYSHQWIKKTCSPETLNSGQNRRSIALCDLEIWQMTLKNNMASLLCCFKLCASFHSHRWIQTKVTVWKRSIRVKIGVLSRVTLTFDRWLWKTIGDLFSATSSPLHHFMAVHVQHHESGKEGIIKAIERDRYEKAIGLLKKTTPEKKALRSVIEKCAKEVEKASVIHLKDNISPETLEGLSLQDMHKECREEMPIISSIMEGALNGNRKRHVLLCLEVHYWIDVFEYFNIHQNH